VVIGRAEDDGVDVIIPEASISKRHCTFAVDAGRVVLSDCGSTNGTSVNGEPVAATPVELAGGETISLGRLQLTFETAPGFVELLGTLPPR